MNRGVAQRQGFYQAGGTLNFPPIGLPAAEVCLLYSVYIGSSKTDLAVLVPAAAQACGLVGFFGGHLAFPLLFPRRIKVIAHGAHCFAGRVAMGNAGVENLFQGFGALPVAVEIHSVGRGQADGRRLGALAQRGEAYNKE